MTAAPQEAPSPNDWAWSVGALCLAIGDALQARFNPIRVRGELSSVTHSASGHCYFTLKDAQGQLRCAMFKRSVSAMNAPLPRDGLRVEVLARLTLYEPRGDLQLVVQSMQPFGEGQLMEAFLQLKAKLQAQGLFAPERKRAIPLRPRAIGVVTSAQAAAWHDVQTALHRRTPHIPVRLFPAAVQGPGAPRALCLALEQLYAYQSPDHRPIDVILLVRGGGALEDLSAFNDERLALTIAQSPVPIISGVGHETDFSIADFVADLRAPTPTAAAELCAQPLSQTIAELTAQAEALQHAQARFVQQHAQWLDDAARTLLQPRRVLIQGQAQRLHTQTRLQAAATRAQERMRHALGQIQTRLDLLHPQHVLDRGFAWVSNDAGNVVSDAQSLQVAQDLHVHLARGDVQVKVSRTRPKRTHF